MPRLQHELLIVEFSRTLFPPTLSSMLGTANIISILLLVLQKYTK